MAQGKRNANLQYLMQDADASLTHVIDESALAQLLAIGGDTSDYSSTTDSLEAISDAIGSIPTTAMRGTDLAYLASVGATAEEFAAHIAHFGGEIFYVNKGGDDSNDGSTPHLAKLTIQAAIDAASPGDAISIKSGTYVENVDMDKAGLELWPEIGTVFDGAGTCITISADSCMLGRPGDRFLATPAADQIGIVVSASGTKAYINGAMVSGSGSAGGFYINGVGAELQWCRATGMKSGGKAFDSGVSQFKFINCSTTGTTTSYGFYAGGATISRGLVLDCTSAGHQTSGFYMDTGVSLVTINDCSSGSGDGRWVDVDSSNVWSNFSFDDLAEKFLTFDASGATSSNLFEITGTVLITELSGHVDTVLAADIGNGYLNLYDGTNTLDVTDSPGPSFNSIPVGSYIHKIDDATVQIEIMDSSQVRLYEDSTKFGEDPNFQVLGKEGATTYLRFTYSDTGTSGQIHWHCKWEPLSHDGFVAPA